MERRTLSGTDLTVSRICFGTMTFGSQVAEPAALRMIDRSIDCGINFFDTANVYNRGASETMLGKALKGKREKVVLASKVRGKMGEGADESGLSREAINRAIDESLRRLGTDYLDLYYLHMPDYAVPLDETVAAIENLVRAGKVRYPAASNYAAWQMVQMLWIADTEKYRPVRVTQPMYNLLARGIEQEYLPMCREFGISTVVYNPLAGGLLTGKYHGETPPPGTRFDKNQLYLDRYWHPAYFEAVEDLRGLAGEAGRSMTGVALNWLLHHTAADCVILGASKLEQLVENLKSLSEGPLAPETLEGCERIWAKLRGVTPNYNR